MELVTLITIIEIIYTTLLVVQQKELLVIMIRMMRGETAMRLEVWRHWLQLENEAKHKRMLEALERKAHDQKADQACQMLKQIMIRMMRGETAMRLDIWGTHLKRAHVQI